MKNINIFNSFHVVINQSKTKDIRSIWGHDSKPQPLLWHMELVVIGSISIQLYSATALESGFEFLFGGLTLSCSILHLRIDVY